MNHARYTTLRTFPDGEDKPPLDIQNVLVRTTRYVRDVAGGDWWCGIARMPFHKEWLDVCKPAYDKRDDIWYRRTDIENSVLVEYSEPTRRDRLPI